MPLLLFVDHNSYFAHNTTQRIRFLFPYLFIFTFLLAQERDGMHVGTVWVCAFYANDMSKQTLDKFHKETFKKTTVKWTSEVEQARDRANWRKR